MRRHQPVTLALILGIATAAVVLGAASARPSGTGTASGRTLYRQFCGQCHALKAALAAGFGGNRKFGTNGGPAFDELRIPYSLSITAVTEPTGGHELVKPKITWPQLKAVATYLETVTKHHPYPALPTDG